jgi:hypothetical protein
MDDSGAGDTSDPYLDLIRTADLIGGHRSVEHGLFVLTGRWSVDVAAGPDPPGIADFFATQSAIHGWRLAEWEKRSPRSVDVTETAEPSGWTRALEVADSASAPTARLACWSQVLGIQLAARYRSHLALTSPVADAGLARWLDIVQRDVLDAVAQGASISIGSEVSADSDPSPEEVADSVAACLVPFLELGF